MYNKADWRNNRTEKGFCMKEIRTEDAVGHILCHDITQIIKDEKKGVLFKKGHVVKEDDIPLLLSVGKEHLFVWEKKEGILHENEAAEILYRICAGDSLKMHGTDIKEGKIEVVSEIDGVLKIRREALVAVNSLAQVSSKVEVFVSMHANPFISPGSFFNSSPNFDGLITPFPL